MQNKTILVVDDEKTVVESFRRILSDAGYITFTADNGKKALEIIKEKKCNIVLTDIVMKGINGLQILKETKRISPDTDVVMITGYGSVTNILDALRKNAVDFIMKPCRDNELLDRMQQVVKRQNERRLAREAEMYKKMTEALGAVAHEINNPLTGILGCAEMLGMENPDNKEVARIITSVERIIDVLERMKEIKGIKTKKYTRDSEILDLQRNSEFMRPEKNTVLVVDDEEAVTSMISDFAAGTSYSADTAASGSEVLEKIKNRNYSVVILDVSMPGMDGYETLLKMNKYYTDREIQIPATIMFTGYDVEEILEKCKAAGAYTVIRKPFKNKELFKIVKEAEEYAGD